MAYIGIVYTTETAIRVNLSGLDTSYESSDRVCSWYINGSYSGQSTLGARVSAGGTYMFSGLSAGTTYDIRAVVTAPNVYAEFSTSATTELSSGPSNPDTPSVAPWNWYRSNGSATAYQTQDAYYAVNSNGSLGSFSYLVWNDMVNKVMDILSAKRLYWDNQFGSYYSTLMSVNDKTLTAARFNSLRYNIGSHYSTGINTVYPGDIVYGWYFTRLTDCMNAWI